MKKCILAIILAIVVIVTWGSTVLATTPTGQKGYEGQPGNQGGYHQNGQKGNEGHPGNQGG